MLGSIRGSLYLLSILKQPTEVEHNRRIAGYASMGEDRPSRGWNRSLAVPASVKPDAEAGEK